MALVTNNPKYYHSDVVNYSGYKYTASEMPDIRIIFDAIDKITQTTLISCIDRNTIDQKLKTNFINILKLTYFITTQSMYAKKLQEAPKNAIAIICLSKVDLLINSKKYTIPERCMFIPQNQQFKILTPSPYCIVFT